MDEVCVTPRLDVSRLPNLCALGPRLLTMTGLFKIWMGNHFGSPATIKIPALRNFVWRPDPKTTTLVIESNTSWNPLLVESRPSLIVKRHAWQNLKIGLNNRMMGGQDASGKTMYANYWQGAHTIFVCAGEDGECDLLANEVFEELNEFGPKLETMLNLFKFSVAEVGEMGKLDEAGENWVVPISVAYALEQAWVVQQEAAPFKRIDIAMLIP